MMNQILQPFVGQIEYEASINHWKVDYLGTPPQLIAS
jgi:hypothetical protein